jgi:hypothetical protein
VALAGIKLVVHLVTIRGYGYFRDELYYIACSDHLAFGYVDHPPLSVALLKVWRLAFADSVVAIRILPAIAGALVVLLAGLLAVELGGGRAAVVLAAVGVIAAPIHLAFDHFYSMNAFDALVWTLGAYLFARITRSPRPGPLWVGLGITLGLGLLNKASVLWFGAGLFAGMLLTPERRHLRTPWPYLAFVIAAGLFLPHVVWQVQHGWPTLEFMRNAMEEKYVARSAGDFVGEQVLMMNPLSLPIWLAGLVAALLDRPVKCSEGPATGSRWVAGIYLTVFAILIGSRSAKAEYLAAAYPMLFAAGGVFWERLFAARRIGWASSVLATLAVLGGAVAAPMVIPILSEERLIAYSRALGLKVKSAEKKELAELPQHFADMHGWQEIVAAVASAHGRLTPDERRGAAILVGNYGEAGAIDLFGGAHGLPRAISGHNNYWLWGPGGANGRVMVLLGGTRDYHEQTFESVEEAGIVECTYCMPHENGKRVFIGRGAKVSMDELWAKKKRFE